MIVVGSDVHVRNTYFDGTDAAGGRLAKGRVANTPAELRGFCERLLSAAGGEVQPVRFVLESTTNSRAVRLMLRQAAVEAGFTDVAVDVLDARKLRIIAESVDKCDAVDARVLNELSRSNLKLPTCYMPDDEEFALREHLRARSDLVCMRTMIKNRVHAVLHRRGILTPENGLFSKDGRKYLDELATAPRVEDGAANPSSANPASANAVLDDAGRAIAKHYLAALDQFESLIGESDRDLKSVMRRERWAKPAAILQTMPGIGVITSLTILAELGDLKRFKCRAAVANYAGLVPVIRDSNHKHYSGGITHRGSAHLRHVLSEAAWTAVKRVPIYQALFERIAQRRGKQVAIVAVARRMLEDAVRMLWKEEVFRFVPLKIEAAVAPHGVAAESNRHGTPCSDPPLASDQAVQHAAGPAEFEVASSVAG